MSDLPQSDEAPSPCVSDEKMDTASESFASSQPTPNTPSDPGDGVLPCSPTGINNKSETFAPSNTAVLRLANPLNNEFPDVNDAVVNHSDYYDDGTDYLNEKNIVECKKSGGEDIIENNESLDESLKDKPLRLGLNCPKLTSTLTLTDDHPLMGLSSPESPPSMSNYPDLILQSRKDTQVHSTVVHDQSHHLLNSDCSGMLSLSSTEDESFNRSLFNGDVSIYSDGFLNQEGPQRNTSKNNLYFSDNFTSSDGNKSIEGSLSSEDPRTFTAIVDGKLSVAKNSFPSKNLAYPDILDTGKQMNYEKEKSERKKVKADVKGPKIKGYNQTPKISGDSSLTETHRTEGLTSSHQHIQNIEDKVMKLDLSIAYVSEVSEFPKSPSQLRSCLNYELPVEVPSNFSADEGAMSGGSCCSSPLGEQDKSLYQTELDPAGGRVALKQRQSTRRRIRLPSERGAECLGSCSSLESLAGDSLHSGDVPLSAPHTTQEDNASLTDTDTEQAERSGENSQDSSGVPAKIPEYSWSEERRDSRLWLKVTLPSGERRTIDMKVIEPYKRVLSHGGYAQSGRRDAIVVFSACFLPDSSRVDYNYVMDNLFLYVLSTLEQLVTDDYILIYLHGSASKRSMPTFHWLNKCYQLIDRRLRKSLKHLFLVHPTFWLKSVMWMTRPFISSKFFRKLSYVHSLEELSAQVPVEPAAIPDRVRQFDAQRA